MKCKICGTKRYWAEKNGCFDCVRCGKKTPLEEMEGSKRYFYYCKDCRYKRDWEYKKKRSSEDFLYKEKLVIGRKIRASIKKNGFKKNGLAEEYLGCTKDEFVEHIESQFRDGMSWENRSEWHIDHIIPLATANTSEEIRRLWHHTNLQPLWRHENEAKGASLDWDLKEYLMEINNENKD